MRKLSFLFLAASLAIYSQTPTQTSNLGLFIPAHGSFNWDSWYNQNWQLLDTKIASMPQAYPAAGVPVSTGSAWGSSLTAPTGSLVGTGQANTYSAGFKQTFGSSSTTAGASFSGVTVDPNTLSIGDMWFRSDLLHLKVYDGSAAKVVMYSTDAYPYSQLTGSPTLYYQTHLANGSASTQRSKINFAAGSNLSVTPTDNGVDTTTYTFAASIPVPGASTLGGVKTITCSAGNHMNAIDGTGTPSCSADTGAGGGGTTRTWLYSAQGVCQGATAGAALWMPASNSPGYVVCDSTHQQGEWQIPATTTGVNWGLQFRVPTGATGSYALALTWRSADSTISHAVTFTPSYACVAPAQNPDNPTYTNLTTFTINPPASASVNTDTAYTFTPTCAAGAQFRLLLTATANTVTQPISVSYESIALTANN